MAGPRASPSGSGRQHKGQTKSLEGDAHTSQQATAPVRASKRRHQATTSPVTARSESRSPRAKQRPVVIRQSPPTITAAPAVAASTTTTTGSSPSGRSRTESRSGSVSPSQLAVPRVSAEPPCPSMLPLPPVHWRAGEDAQSPAQRQHCRAVTESLLNHLTTSGILVTA